MEIKRLTNAMDLMPIFKLDDNIEKDFPCNKSEWVQWLISIVQNERVNISVAFDGKIVLAYYILIDNINPPLQDSVMIVYLWSDNKIGIEVTKQLSKSAETWAKERGAKRITAKTTLPNKYLEMFGYKTVAKFVEKIIE